MTTITDGDIVRRIISFQLICHPLPWEVVEDWTFEVAAKDGTVIVKTPTRSEADRVIEIAVEVDRQMRNASHSPSSDEFCPEAPHG